MSFYFQLFVFGLNLVCLHCYSQFKAYCRNNPHLVNNLWFYLSIVCIFRIVALPKFFLLYKLLTKLEHQHFPCQKNTKIDTIIASTPYLSLPWMGQGHKVLNFRLLSLYRNFTRVYLPLWCLVWCKYCSTMTPLPLTLFWFFDIT